VTEWIRSNKQLSDADFATLRKLFPMQYEYAINTSLEDLMEMNTRHRNSQIYGKYIEILLSPKGLIWLKDNYENLHKYEESLRGKNP
ncbi:MAG: hypothetical protein QW505_04420, partial [Thermoplasmata archaeon]